MKELVERTCTELRPSDADGVAAEAKPLSAYRSQHAYVLLGDPGSGKTTAFQSECKEIGDDALFIAARDFLIHESIPDEWPGRMLFIDGLDEVRAGASDVRAPFDQIRRRLIDLGRPRFRISCREADWLGENDRQKLGYVAQDSTVTALRLDALTQLDIEYILSRHLGVSNPKAFIEQAHEQGVGGLLANPQGLELLAKAVKQGREWPTSRLETFERACQQMAREHNKEHLNANRRGTSINSLIDCAGRLCALQLISGRIGYSLGEDSADDNYAPLDACDQGDPSGLRAAPSSKLFKADSERRFSPVHRQIAEFLGAKHLARLIANGLPARRVLALMTGGDGIVVTALRGLSAWLATHSAGVRTELVNNDPVGVGLYGDIHVFSPTEKQKLLASLARQPKYLARAYANVKGFAPLVAAETEPDIRRILESKDRNPVQEAQTGFVLLMLDHGQRLPDLSEKMVEIVRDDSRSPRVRQLALDAFIRNRQDSTELARELAELLAHIKANGISAANREICGTLLGALYPGVVRPRQIWDYLTERAGTDSSGRYAQFWSRKLVAQSSENDVPDLLDSLASQVSRLDLAFEDPRLRKLPVALLERGLRVHGDVVKTARVYQWLGAGATVVDRFPGYYPPEAVLKIRAWLEERPEIQKQVISMGLESGLDAGQVQYWDFRNRKRLFGAKLPADFGLWCLKQSVDLAERRPRVARHLFLEAYSAYKTLNRGEGLSIDVLHEHARQDEQLEKLLAELLSPPPTSQDEMDWQRQHEKHGEEQEQQEQEWLAWVRSNERALLENRAEPALLYQLALVYFGLLPDTEGDVYGKPAVARALGEFGTITAAMHGIRHATNRDDLPDLREIIRLAKDQREHYLSLPLLAALDLAESSLPGFLRSIADSTIRVCVACYHYWAPDISGSRGSRLNWYQWVLDSRPEIVSEVAVQCAAAALRRKQPVSERFWDIAEGDVRSDVASGAVLSVLGVFPLRCHSRQLDALDQLLWTGLRYRAEVDLLDLAGQKLPKVRMNVGQRVRWLGLGLICAPEDHGDTIAELVDGKERLIRHLARFYVRGADPLNSDEGSWRYPYEDLDGSTLGIIIRLLGKCFAPYEVRGFGYVTDEFRVSLFLIDIVNRLASKPENGASVALESLLGDVNLDRWHGRLSEALDAQRTIRRDAEYCHPTLAEACETLRGGQPANPGDLAAFTIDLLHKISTRIRTSNTNDWRQYWNEGPHGKPSEPRVENACRDALLSDIKLLLPDSVDAQPEWQHVNETRADIEISARGFHLPMEVKRNSDPRLWSAVHEQLIARYTVDPATNGYGIFVVFWFGVDRQRRHPNGTRPRSPEELQSQLEEPLGEGPARKISICVIDVSRGK